MLKIVEYIIIKILIIVCMKKIYKNFLQKNDIIKNLIFLININSIKKKEKCYR